MSILGPIFALAVLIGVCVVVAILMDVAIKRAGFWPESKPLAVAVVILIALVGYFGRGRFFW